MATYRETLAEKQRATDEKAEARWVASKDELERIRAAIKSTADEAELKGLRKELKRAERENMRAIRGRPVNRVSLRDVREAMKAVTTFEGLTFDGSVLSYGGQSQNVESARVLVETAGQLDRRTTLTRVAAGGFLFGPAGAVVGALAKKKVDHRELYLVVDGDLYAWAVPVNPNKGAEARAFAAKVNTASRVQVPAEA